jgi:RNA 3'-terminal phosphate cyclase
MLVAEVCKYLSRGGWLPVGGGRVAIKADVETLGSRSNAQLERAERLVAAAAKPKAGWLVSWPAASNNRYARMSWQEIW